jgi:hypothetical protein
MLFAQNKLTAVADVVQYVEYFLVFYLLLVSVLVTRERLRLVVLLWLAVGSAAVLWGLVDYLSAGRTDVQVSGPFLNRNLLGGYVAMLLPLAWGVMLYSQRVGTVVQGLVLAVLGFVVMLAGGPWLAAALGIVLITVTRSAKLAPVLLAAFLALVLAVFPLLPRKNAAILVRSLHVFDEQLKTDVRVENPNLTEAARLSPRYVQWQAAAKFLTPGAHRELGIPRSVHLRQLLLGVGIGNYQQNIGQFYGTLPLPNVNTVEPDTHNLYLVLAVSAGIPAALAFLWLLGGFARRAGEGCLRAEDPFVRGVLLGCTGSLAALVVTNVFTSTLVHGSGPAMVIVFALAASGLHLAERKAVVRE